MNQVPFRGNVFQPLQILFLVLQQDSKENLILELQIDVNYLLRNQHMQHHHAHHTLQKRNI